MAMTNVLLSQTKFVNKGFKAFNEKNWEKFKEFLEKEKEKDSMSVGTSFLNSLLVRNDGLAPNAKLYFNYSNDFFNKLEKLDVKEQAGYCEDIGYCLSNKSKLYTENLKNYSDWLVQRKDTSEANYFLKNFPNDQNSISIRNFQFEHYYQLLSKIQTRDETKKYLLRFPQSNYYPLVAKMNDSLQFQFVIQQNNVNTFESYLVDYPEGKFRDSAKRSIENLSWVKISNSTDKNDFIVFQNKFPNSYFYKSAIEKEISMTWNEVKTSNSIDLIQEFRQKYSLSKFDAEAEILESDLVFAEAKNSKSVELIKDFRETYKNSKHVSSAYVLEQQWAFDEIKASKNIELCEKYLIEYPNSALNKRVDTLIYNHYINVSNNNFDPDSLKILSRKTTNKRFTKFIEKRIAKLNQLDSSILVANELIKSGRSIVPPNVVNNTAKGRISIKTSKSLLEFVDVRNNPNDFENYNHDYVTYIPILKSHFIYLNFMEGRQSLLVDESTGKSNELNGSIVSFFRTDTTLNWFVKLQCEPGICAGFEIMTKGKKESKVTYKFSLDSTNYSIAMDSVYFEDDKIFCLKSYNYYEYNYKVFLGKLEFQRVNKKWQNTAFYPNKSDSSAGLNPSFMNQLIEKRQPFFNTSNSKNPIYKLDYNDQSYRDEYIYAHRFIYEIDQNELRPVRFGSNYALYPIKFIDQDFLNSLDLNGNKKFDLICTKRPFAGLDYSNVSKYLNDYQSRDELIFINFDSALFNGEIQQLPIEFNQDRIRLMNVFYTIFKEQHPNSLSPTQVCSFIAKNYTFIDEFKKKKLIEQWAEYEMQNLIKNEEFYKSLLNSTLGYKCVAHLNEYNMETQMFKIELKDENSYSSDKDELKNMLESLRSNESNSSQDYLNNTMGFSIKLNHPRKSNDYYNSSFNIYVKEDKASQLSNILNGERNLYLRIKTKITPWDYKETCNICPSGNCDNSHLSDCKLNFDVTEYEFSATPDFKDVIKVKP